MRQLEFFVTIPMAVATQTLSVRARGAEPCDVASTQTPGFKVMRMQDMDVRSSRLVLLSYL